MIKHFFAGIFLLCIPASLSIAQQLNDWENPLVNGINRQPAHSALYSYDNSDIAKTADRTKSTRVLSLNGNFRDFWDVFRSEKRVAGGYIFVALNQYVFSNLDKLAIEWELTENGIVVLNNINLKQMGVGGNDSWTQRAFPLKQYQIKPGKYSYSFILRPLVSK